MLGLQKKHFTVFTILIFQFLLSVIGGMIVAFTPRENVIFPGVSINGVNVGGLTAGKALEVLNENLKHKIENGVVELYYNSQKSKIKYSDLGVKYDIKAAVNEILKEQRNITQGAAIAMIRAHVKEPDYPLHYTLDNEKLTRVLQSVSRKNNIAVQNAKINVSGRELKIIPDRDGLEVNLSLTEKKLREAISKLDHRPLRLEVSRIKPDITTEDLKLIADSVGLGITNVSRTDRDKYMAVKTSAKMLDGLLISPGEEFSFNSTLGTSVKDRKYLDPQVTQQDGRLTLVSDNALSQVASTLYQAVLYSDLTITERWRHSEMPGYVSPGQDAAVAIDKLDFKFKNNGSNPVYILVEVKGNYLIINLLGVKKEGRTVQIISRQEENTKYPGMVVAKVYRVIYENGNETKRELISEDKYVSGTDRR